MSDKNFMSYGDAETVLTEFATKLQFKQIEYSVWNAMSAADKAAYIEAHPCIQVKSVPDTGRDEVNIFAIASSAWGANSGSDATDFPYVANILTDKYASTFIPANTQLLGADASDYPTATDETAMALVDKYIKFTGTEIRLRATAAPATALTLVIRG